MQQKISLLFCTNIICILVFSILSLDTNADSMCIEAMSLFAAMYEQIEMGGFPEQLFPCSKVTHRLKN